MTAPREIIAKAISGTPFPSPRIFRRVEGAISELTAAGYRILGPDDLDPVTLERAASEYEKHNKIGREWAPGSFWGSVAREGAARVRSLKGERS
jgi:hypothetical protein